MTLGCALHALHMIKIECGKVRLDSEKQLELEATCLPETRGREVTWARVCDRPSACHYYYSLHYWGSTLGGLSRAVWQSAVVAVVRILLCCSVGGDSDF